MQGKAPTPAEVAYQQGMRKGWMDFGWSPRKKNPGGPELHDLSGYGGWILTRETPMTAQQAGGVTFTYKADASFGDFLEVKLDKPGTSLSGGQQQRLCIARTLAVDPEVVLMDEPCSALDPIATARIEDLLHDLRRDYTIIIVTHNLQQATRVSDRTGFFLQGDLIELGETDQIFTSPQDRRTEDYITGKFG